MKSTTDREDLYYKRKSSEDLKIMLTLASPERSKVNIRESIDEEENIEENELKMEVGMDKNK